MIRASSPVVRAFAAALISCSVIALTPQVSLAEEILPGFDVQGATVTGPGLSPPVSLDAHQAAEIARGFEGQAIFHPQIQRPSARATIFSVQLQMTVKGIEAHPTPILVAWDGTNTLVSGGDLLARKQFMVVPPAIVGVMGPIVSRVPPVASSSQAGTSATVIVVVTVVVLAVLLGAVLVWRRRRA